MTTVADAVFLDTNVLVAASVEGHPSHQVAVALLQRINDGRSPACVSPQVCREFLSVMTRAPLEGTSYEPREAISVLGAWLRECAVVEEPGEILGELLRLVEQHGVRGTRVHDANLVATMLVNRVSRLATLNGRDFRRFDGEIELEPVTS